MRVAEAGFAAEDRELVLDRLATAAGEDGRKLGETCPMFLVAFGGEASEPATVRQHVGAESWALPSGGIAEAVENREID